MSDRPDKPTDGSDKDYYKVLSDVMSDQKERDERRAKSAVHRASRGSSTVPGVVAMVCGVLSVYLWTSPPAFIQPDPFPTATVEQIEAGARLSLYFQARTINFYVRDNGRLPRTLDEAGRVESTEIVYQRQSEQVYQLSIPYGDDGSTLTYRSDQDLVEFRGNAMDVLDGRIGP